MQDNSPAKPNGSKDGSDDRFDCGGCPHTDQCRGAWSAPNKGPLSPVGLSLGSAVAFLLPLLTAIVGAGIAQANVNSQSSQTAWQIAGGAGGLAVGFLLAKAILPLIRRRFRAENR